jgi:gamma-glutamyltranspeptidase/glutathione hydrolase
VKTIAVILALVVPSAALADPLIVPSAVVAADHPLASQAGIEILRAGGNAVDAAVAVGLVLGVVNPFASGLGGGGFMVHRDAESGEVVALDFRERAPAAATRDMYVVDGTAVADLSQYGGLAVGVPGEAAGWWEAHQAHGRLPWSDVVEPALRLARDGFPVGQLLGSRLASDSHLDAFPALAEHFRVDGELAVEGVTITRPMLASTLETLQSDGRNGFYLGDVASDIVETVRDAGGILTLSDLENYEPRWLEPVVSEYRDHTVFGMPAPSSGGLVVARVLSILEEFELSRGAFEDAITAHIIAQAFAHAFADRAMHLGDPDYWDIPVDRFLGAARLSEALTNYDPVRTLPTEAYGPLLSPPVDAGTSHFSIVDSAGNAAACTVTVNTSFGSHVIGSSSGIVFNNEMDDFSAQPGVPNTYGLVGGEANAISPGKRPLSSMSPTIVVRDGEVVGVVGGSGGPMIITETVLAIVQMIDFGRNADEAVTARRFHQQWLPAAIFVEDADDNPWSAESLAEFGYEVSPRPFLSAVQVVWAHSEGWQAASDPRKHGAPAGY